MARKKTKSPRIKVAKISKKYIKVLAFDMGTKNLAWAMLDKQKLIEVGFVKDTVTCLIGHEYQKQMQAFANEFTTLIKKYQPTGILIERFQSRGMGGNTIELLNIMIGIMTLISTNNKIDVVLAAAVSWKGAHLRQFGPDKTLNDLYQQLKPFPPHFIDAHCQSYYLANIWRDNPFEKWSPQQIKKKAQQWIYDWQREKKQRAACARLKKSRISGRAQT